VHWPVEGPRPGLFTKRWWPDCDGVKPNHIDLMKARLQLNPAEMA